MQRDSERALATAQLLWAACSGDPPPGQEAVIAALDAGADVRWAARIALVQRIGPLLWRALEMSGRSAGLGAVGEALEVDSLVRRTQAELLIPRAVALAIDPLRRAGLEPMIFKGPAVAARYPAAGLRPMDDIDVLLPAHQHDQAVALLETAGWEVYRSEHSHVYDTVLLHPGVPDLPLELHRGLSSWRDRSNNLTVDALWTRRLPTTCLGTDAFGLPPEEELVALAAHAGKPFHSFSRLMWVVDLAVVVRAAGPAFDWDRVAAFAREARCPTALAIGLRLASRLGLTAPDELLVLPRSWVRADAFNLVLDERWPVETFDDAVRHRMRYALSDGHVHHARMLAGEVTLGGWHHAPVRMARLAHSGARRWIRSRRPA
jgi:hypothetical protein